MSFEAMCEWLARKLAHADDLDVGAGGTSLEALRKDAELRTVTPTVLADAPTEVGKVVRYVREHRGWSRQELADLAEIDEAEVERIETVVDHALAPRTVTNLASVCGFSKVRLQTLAGHISVREQGSTLGAEFRFAARSRNVDSVSAEEFDAVRALVEVLSDRALDKK